MATHTIGGLYFPIIRKTVRIREARNQTPNTATFTTRAREDGTIPQLGQEVELVDPQGASPPDIAFRGYLLKVERDAFTLDDANPTYQCSCVDFTWELDWHCVDRTSYALFVPVNASDIVIGIIEQYAPTISTNNVEASSAIPDIIEFKAEHGELVSSILNRIAQMIGATWYVDYDRDLHFFITPETSGSLPDLDVSNREFSDFVYTQDFSQVRTRVKVFGATTALTELIEADAAAMAVADTAPFSDTGGRCVVRNSEVIYTGKSTASGPGSLTGISPSMPIGSVLTESYAGDVVQVLAIEEDATAATALITTLGVGDGFIEHAIVDTTLDDAKSHQAALADLQQNTSPEPLITYTTRNPNATAGKTLSVNLTDTATGEIITGDFQLQTVDISDDGGADNRLTRRITAGRNRTDFYSLLNNKGVTSGASGAVSSSGGGGGPGQLINKIYITATGSGTYTPSAGTRRIDLELQGAGAGGGSADGTTGLNAVGLGGGGGAWLQKRLTADFAGASYVVGAKGPGGTSPGNNNGTDGGDTTFTTSGGSPVTYTAGGGKGGDVGGPSTNFARSGGAGLGAGGLASGGDIEMHGGDTSVSIALVNGNAVGGMGGSSRYANARLGATIGAANTSSLGGNASGKGGGGSGGVCSGTATAVVGGDGSDGMIVIWEWS